MAVAIPQHDAAVWDYFHDGKRLACVLGVDRAGHYQLEDCATETVFTLNAAELRLWKWVEFVERSE